VSRGIKGLKGKARNIYFIPTMLSPHPVPSLPLPNEWYFGHGD